MAMASEGSITHCIHLMKTGERTAAQQLWERYFQRLVGLVRTHLRGTSRSAADEEDVALSAFESFYQRAECGQFPQLNDRDDLWQLLVVVTVRKAIDLVRHEGRPTRGSGRVLVLSDLAGPGLEQVLDPEPTPELAARWPMNAGGSMAAWAMTRCAQWRGGRWKGTPTPRSLRSSGVCRKRSSVSSARSDGFGPKGTVGVRPCF